MVTTALVKAMGVNRERKSGAEPRRQSTVVLDTSLTVLAVNLVPNLLVLPFLWIIPVRLGGRFCYRGSSVSAYIFPPERKLRLCFSVERTRELTETGYKSKLN